MFYNFNFEQKRSDFVSYLRKENDIESLRQIGEINSFGSYERWNPNFSKMLDYFLIATKEKKALTLKISYMNYFSMRKNIKNS